MSATSPIWLSSSSFVPTKITVKSHDRLKVDLGGMKGPGSVHDKGISTATLPMLASFGQRIPFEDGKDVVPPSQGKAKEALRINTSNVSSAMSPTIDRRRHPGPLGDAKKSKIPAPQSALASARIISDISSVQYPEGVSSPRPDLNKDAKEGKFRYDRDFLLQFMPICKTKPASMAPLDAIGLEPLDPSSSLMQRGGSGRHRTSTVATLPPSRQASIGLGFDPSTLGKRTAGGFSAMGQFTSVGAGKFSSEERFRAASATSGPGLLSSGLNVTVGSASTGGAGAPRKTNKGNIGQGEQQGPAVQNSYQNAQQQMTLEQVAPLTAPANRDSPEMMDQVKRLIKRLTMEEFDSVSDQIIAWVNMLEEKGDGRTLIQVIKLVFEKATDEATRSEMYARLCRKMMEQISPKVQDEGAKNNEGKPIAGGQLFRKYLLNRCQEDFERGWKAKEATAKAAAFKVKEDEAVKSGDSKEEVALYSEEYYAAQKAKRQGLGLIKFIGELFKLQMLTERTMHECVKKLLGDVDNPEEEEIERLCTLLTTVGHSLDTQKAKTHMYVYFSRMKELRKNPHVSLRTQSMLQDIIKLRERKWASSRIVATPTVSRTAASLNMFSMLEAAVNPAEFRNRRKLVLQPRYKPVEHKTAEASFPAVPEMTEKDVSRKLEEDIKEFFSIKSMNEDYFTDIPVKLRFKLVENFTCAVLEKKEADARLLAQFFTHAVSKGVCSPESFEDGFTRVAEIVFDVVIDAPKALDYFAVAVIGAGLPENIRSNIAAKSEDPERLLALFL